MEWQATAAERADRLVGTLLGTAVGDSLGLPREGLSRRRAQKMFGDTSGLRQVQHGLVLGRGMVSDDTEHAAMAAQALLAAPDDAKAFAKSLAWRLRGWLAGAPAGVGWGTLRAILKLWVGVPPSRSGVQSAGNGPCMRAPVIGAALAFEPERLSAFVHASSVLTHRDARAVEAAAVVARAAGAAARSSQLQPQRVLDALVLSVSEPTLREALVRAREALKAGRSVQDFADSLGLGRGVSGYALHTAPVALYAWLRHPSSFRDAVESVIRLGGDTDTTGAIVGGLCGATLGASAIPPEWTGGLMEWPRSVAWLRELGGRLARAFPCEGQGHREGPLPLFWPGLLPRNVLFGAVVLLHGLRRMLPPY